MVRIQAGVPIFVLNTHMTPHEYDVISVNVRIHRPATIASGFYDSVSSRLIEKLPVRTLTSYTYGSPIPDELPTEIADIIRRSTGFQALIIRNPDQKFILIEYTDGPSGTTGAIDTHAPHFLGAVVCQYDALSTAYKSSPYQIVPGYFSRNMETPLPPYTGTIDKLVFVGTVHPDVPERQALLRLREHPDLTLVEGYVRRPDGANIRPVEYSHALSQYASHRAVLALRGTSYFCFREFDILAGGYPLISHELNYTSQMEPLVDDEHYFAVPFDPHPEVFARRLIDKFNDVRGDTARLERVRRNGQSWFFRNATWQGITDRLYEWTLRILSC